jgi:hypothetical protein
MNSGIYKLTFLSNKIYIGKSENIEARWKQHQASFIKGTHTKKLQREYDQYGEPRYDTLLYVHPDHIDIYESIIIQTHWGVDCLNGNRPKPSTHEDAQMYLEYYDKLELNTQSIMMYSSLAHLQAIEQYHNKLTNTLNELELSVGDVQELETRGIKTPEGWQEVNDNLSYTNDMLNSENAQLSNECNNYHRELKRLKKLSLWDRLFNYSVYV